MPDLRDRLKPILSTLVADYRQEIRPEEVVHLLDRVTELMQGYKWIKMYHVEKACQELLRFPTHYHKVSVATYMEAFRKVNIKNDF